MKQRKTLRTRIRPCVRRIGIFLGAAALVLGAGLSSVTPSYASGIPGEQLKKVPMGGGYAVTGQLKGVGYTTELYDARNGLPTSDANCVFSASDGYIWVGGYSGILRYDGRTFERFDSTQGLTSGRVIFEDRDHRMWIGTNDNGIVVMDGEESYRITYKDGLPSSSVRGICQCGDGTIVVGTTSGMVTVDVELKAHLIRHEAVNEQYISRMKQDEAGRIYANTNNGDVICVENGSVIGSYTSKQLGIGDVSVIYPDPKDHKKLYIGTIEGKLYYGTLWQGRIRLEQIETPQLQDEVTGITSACDRIWVNTLSNTGYLDEWKHFHLLEDIPLTNSIEMMTADYQGNLWYASSRQGVMKVVSCNFRDILQKAGMEPTVVNTTCVRDGLVYIGADDGLKIVSDTELKVENELTRYIDTTRIRCIMKDSKDNLWICTYVDDKGLICYTPDDRMIHYTTKNGLVSNETRCVTEASDGSILVGTNGGLSIIRNGSVVKNISEADGLTNTVLLSVEEGGDGCIYAGSDGNGIHVIDGDKIRDITREDGLTSDVILRIKHDKKRNVDWLITSNSIQYIRDGKVCNVSSFPYNNNFDIYFGEGDAIWILSSYGIYRVRAQELLDNKVQDYQLYTLANGLPGVPTANGFSDLSEDGILYVAERTGACRMDINGEFGHSSDIHLGLKSVTCDGEELFADEDGGYTIPRNTGRVQIHVAALDYTMSNPTVRVFLEGSDDEGITVNQDQLSALEYTGLKYGKYTLHIQTVDPATDTVYQEETVNFTKKPAFLEITAVQILGVAVLLLLVGFFVWRLMNSTVVRRQYAEIRAAKEEAEQANMAKSRFLANMSHEIRTPINTIMGMDEMLLREDATGVPKEYFTSVINYALDIRGASESLLGLINDILDISKIESGGMHLVEHEYNTAELIRSIVTMIRVRAEQKELAFDVIVDEEMPERMFGDSEKIKQIILNLLTNAVKYTSVGGFSLTAKVESKDGDTCSLRFAVKDSGIGVKEEDLEKLFVAYERLDEEKNTGIQGTGLGLDISRRFVELMDGKIWCESEYGEGAEFIVTFDQQMVGTETIGVFNEHEDEVVRGPYVPQFIAPEAEVLVVDDNPMNLSVIRNLLKATRVFVTTSESGEDGLEKIKYGSFDVVLLDHMMPGMDGIETLEKIRETHPDLPVYALTANATSGEEFYTSKGFTGYLSKPVDSLALEKAIMKHLPDEIMQKPAEDYAAMNPTDPDKLPEEMNWVKEVEGIRIEDGIKASGGVNSYVNSLGTFLETIEPSNRVISEAYRDGDIRLYTVKVHALKSSARIIGAGDLAALAEKLEKAGNNEDMDTIHAETEHLLSELLAFKEKLAPLHAGSDSDDREPIPEKTLADAYRTLREVIPQMDYDAVEMILEELKGYRLADKDKETCEKLTTLLKSFDWEAMEKLVEE